MTISYLAEEEEDAQAVKKQIESEGGQCLCVPGDLMDDTVCEGIVKKHMEKYGHLEILINNVSLARGGFGGVEGRAGEADVTWCDCCSLGFQADQMQGHCRHRRKLSSPLALRPTSACC